MEQKEYYDIIIIGAGPAGCTCALSLVNSGLKVLLIDKATFPRDKVCGDAIPGNALKTLKKVLPKAEQILNNYSLKQNINTSTLISAKGKKISITWIGNAINSTRKSWDNFLFNQVLLNKQIIVKQGCTIKTVTKIIDGFVAVDSNENTLTTKLLINAEGALGNIARQVNNNNIDYKNNAVAVRQYYKNLQAPHNDNLFVLIKDYPQSYFWIFPLTNNLFNVGFGIVKNKKVNQQIDVKKVFQKIIETHFYLAPIFKNKIVLDDVAGFKLPLYQQSQNISDENYMLCGDVAQLIDPLQGHGIDKAMESGRLAGLHAELCFKQNNFTKIFMQQYNAQVYNSIGKELHRNKRIANLIMHKPFVVELIAIIYKWKWVQKQLNKLV